MEKGTCWYDVRTIRKGDCINQIPMIKHRELAMSEDFEVLEIVAPSDFKTYVVDPPEESNVMQ